MSQGHEDLDTLDHFGEGLCVPETVHPNEVGVAAHGVGVTRYGAGHEDLDTASKFTDGGGALDLVPAHQGETDFVLYPNEALLTSWPPPEEAYLNIGPGMIPQHNHKDDFVVRYARAARQNKTRPNARAVGSIAPMVKAVQTRTRRLQQAAQANAAAERRRRNDGAAADLPQVRGAFGSTRASRPARVVRKAKAKAKAKATQRPQGPQSGARGPGSGAAHAAAMLDGAAALGHPSAASATAGGGHAADRFLTGHEHGSGSTVLLLNTRPSHVVQGYHPRHEGMDTHSSFDNQAEFVPGAESSMPSHKVVQAYVNARTHPPTHQNRRHCP